MTPSQWKAFDTFRIEFKTRCTEWNEYKKELLPLQKQAAEKNTPAYPLETPIVYNTDLDRFKPEDEIKLIVIGDNPGKNEQLQKNRRYLVGQAGKLAEGFFRRNPELGIDFRKNVLILNKTPVHTAKTAQLRSLIQNGSPSIQKLIRDSQIWMAHKTAELHQALFTGEGDNCPKLWLVGYAELKNRGLFIPYRNELAASYTEKPGAWQHVLVYQHFSMNRFLIDLHTYSTTHTGVSLSDTLERLGEKHRNEIFATSV